MNIYEDAVCRIHINEQPATLGHVKIFPVHQADFFDELPPEHIVHMYMIASKISSVLFDHLKAQGTNIIVRNEYQKSYLEIITRFQEDTLGLIWEPKQGNPQEIQAIGAKIAGVLFPKEKSGHTPVQEHIKVNNNPDDQRISHLRRLG